MDLEVVAYKGVGRKNKKGEREYEEIDRRIVIEKGKVLLKKWDKVYSDAIERSIFGEGVKGWAIQHKHQVGNVVGREKFLGNIQEALDKFDTPEFSAYFKRKIDLIKKGPMEPEPLWIILRYAVENNIFLGASYLRTFLLKFKENQDLKKIVGDIPVPEVTVKSYIELMTAINMSSVQNFLDSGELKRTSSYRQLDRLIEEVENQGFNFRELGFQRVYSAFPSQLSRNFFKKDIVRNEVPVDLFDRIVTGFKDPIKMVIRTKKFKGLKTKKEKEDALFDALKKKDPSLENESLTLSVRKLLSQMIDDSLRWDIGALLPAIDDIFGRKVYSWLRDHDVYRKSFKGEDRSERIIESIQSLDTVGFRQFLDFPDHKGKAFINKLIAYAAENNLLLGTNSLGLFCRLFKKHASPDLAKKMEPQLLTLRDFIVFQSMLEMPRIKGLMASPYFLEMDSFLRTGFLLTAMQVSRITFDSESLAAFYRASPQKVQKSLSSMKFSHSVFTQITYRLADDDIKEYFREKGFEDISVDELFEKLKEKAPRDWNVSLNESVERFLAQMIRYLNNESRLDDLDILKINNLVQGLPLMGEARYRGADTDLESKLEHKTFEVFFKSFLDDYYHNILVRGTDGRLFGKKGFFFQIFSKENYLVEDISSYIGIEEDVLYDWMENDKNELPNERQLERIFSSLSLLNGAQEKFLYLLEIEKDYQEDRAMAAEGGKARKSQMPSLTEEDIQDVKKFLKEFLAQEDAFEKGFAGPEGFISSLKSPERWGKLSNIKLGKRIGFWDSVLGRWMKNRDAVISPETVTIFIGRFRLNEDEDEELVDKFWRLSRGDRSLTEQKIEKKWREEIQNKSKIGVVDKKEYFTSIFNELCRFSGFSNSKIAELLGVTLDTIGYWQKGTATPESLKMATSIAEELVQDEDWARSIEMILLGIAKERTADKLIAEVKNPRNPLELKDMVKILRIQKAQSLSEFWESLPLGDDAVEGASGKSILSHLERGKSNLRGESTAEAIAEYADFDIEENIKDFVAMLLGRYSAEIYLENVEIINDQDAVAEIVRDFYSENSDGFFTEETVKRKIDRVKQSGQISFLEVVRDKGNVVGIALFSEAEYPFNGEGNINFLDSSEKKTVYVLESFDVVGGPSSFYWFNSLLERAFQESRQESLSRNIVLDPELFFGHKINKDRTLTYLRALGFKAPPQGVLARLKEKEKTSFNSLSLSDAKFFSLDTEIEGEKIDAAMSTEEEGSHTSPSFQEEFWDAHSGKIVKKIDDSHSFLSLFSYDKKTRKAVVDKLLTIISKEEKILSVGEGQGHLAKALKKKGVLVDAVDISQENIKSAAKKGIVVKKANATELPFDSDSYDAVVFNESIGGMPVSDVLEEARRCLKPGGVIIIVTYDNDQNRLEESDSHTAYSSFELGSFLEAASYTNIYIDSVDLKEAKSRKALSFDIPRMFVITAEKPDAAMSGEVEVEAETQDLLRSQEWTHENANEFFKILLNKTFADLLKEYVVGGGSAFWGKDGFLIFLKGAIEAQTRREITPLELSRLVGFSEAAIIQRLYSEEGLLGLKYKWAQRLIRGYGLEGESLDYLSIVGQEMDVSKAKEILEEIFEQSLIDYYEIEKGRAFWGKEGFAHYLKKKMEEKLGEGEKSIVFFMTALGVEKRTSFSRMSNGDKGFMSKMQVQLIKDYPLSAKAQDYLFILSGERLIEKSFVPESYAKFSELVESSLEEYLNAGGDRISGDEGYLRYLFNQAGMKDAKKIGFDFKGAISKTVFQSWIFGKGLPAEKTLKKIVSGLEVSEERKIDVLEKLKGLRVSEKMFRDNVLKLTSLVDGGLKPAVEVENKLLLGSTDEKKNEVIFGVMVRKDLYLREETKIEKHKKLYSLTDKDRFDPQDNFCRYSLREVLYWASGYSSVPIFLERKDKLARWKDLSQEQKEERLKSGIVLLQKLEDRTVFGGESIRPSVSIMNPQSTRKETVPFNKIDAVFVPEHLRGVAEEVFPQEKIVFVQGFAEEHLSYPDEPGSSYGDNKYTVPDFHSAIAQYIESDKGSEFFWMHGMRLNTRSDYDEAMSGDKQAALRIVRQKKADKRLFLRRLSRYSGQDREGDELSGDNGFFVYLFNEWKLKDEKFSEHDFYERTGISISIFKRIKEGTTPSLATLKTVINHLQLSDIEFQKLKFFRRIELERKGTSKKPSDPAMVTVDKDSPYYEVWQRYKGYKVEDVLKGPSVNLEELRGLAPYRESINSDYISPFFHSNERRFDEMLFELWEEPLPAKDRDRLFVGTSGLQNLDIMAARQSQYGIIVDHNPDVIELFDAVSRIIRQEDVIDAETFKEKVLEYIKSRYASVDAHFLSGRVYDLEHNWDNFEFGFMKYEETFQHIRQMFIANRIVVVHQDFLNIDFFKALGSWIDKKEMFVDAFYVSSILRLHWEAEDHIDFVKNVHALSDSKTLLISATAFGKGPGTYVYKVSEENPFSILGESEKLFPLKDEAMISVETSNKEKLAQKIKERREKEARAKFARNFVIALNKYIRAEGEKLSGEEGLFAFVLGEVARKDIDLLAVRLGTSPKILKNIIYEDQMPSEYLLKKIGDKIGLDANAEVVKLIELRKLERRSNSALAARSVSEEISADMQEVLEFEKDIFANKSNGLTLNNRPQIDINGKKQSFVLGANNLRFYEYLRIGSLIFITPELKSSLQMQSFRTKNVIELTGHLPFLDYCIPIIAAMLEQDFNNKVVWDYGTGNGVLGMAAMRLGAKRVIGVDSDPLELDMAEEAFLRAGYKTVRLKESDWLNYEPKADDQVILIEGNVKTITREKNSGQTKELIRKRYVGSSEAFIVTNMGSFYPDAHQKVLEEVIKGGVLKAILGGYKWSKKKFDDGPRSPKKAIDLLEAAGYVADLRSYTGDLFDEGYFEGNGAIIVKLDEAMTAHSREFEEVALSAKMLLHGGPLDFGEDFVVIRNFVLVLKEKLISGDKKDSFNKEYEGIQSIADDLVKRHIRILEAADWVRTGGAQKVKKEEVSDFREKFTDLFADIKKIIVGYAGLLDQLKEQDLSDVDDRAKVEEYLSILGSLTNRYNNINLPAIEALLGGKEQVAKEEINLEKFLQEANGKFEIKQTDRPMEVTINDVNSNIFIESNKNVLFVILERFVSNGYRVSTESLEKDDIEMSVVRADGKVKIVFTNTGKIDPAKLEINPETNRIHLFDYDYSVPMKQTAGGVGLGYSIRMAERLGIKINVRNLDEENKVEFVLEFDEAMITKKVERRITNPENQGRIYDRMGGGRIFLSIRI